MFHFKDESDRAWRLGSVDGTAVLHIHQNAFPGLIQPQGFSFLIDMGDHELGDFVRPHGESPFAETHGFQLFEQVLVELGAFHDGKGDAEYRINA